jgi:glucosyl-3-phosphoglycerate synthase
VERTWSASEFAVEDLAAAKARQGLTVSVVLPARNEAETVGGVVAACAQLSGVLVDELLVVDGSSDDGTADQAAQAGATVVRDSDLLPEYGHALGKGDALWRSLSATTGDVVVWVDTDIRDARPEFVTGLLGPLLADPAVQFVKAFYERPLMVGEVRQPTGGGRVTELLARPLLNLFWPALASLVQPLSGEYAGRRALLETLPFFTGYGVELGLLVDVLAAAGPEAIGQVDLENRIHRNQDLPSLSRMAFGIVQVAMRRLRDDGRLAPGALPEDYLQFTRSPDGMVGQRVHVPVVERPPLASLKN